MAIRIDALGMSAEPGPRYLHSPVPGTWISHPRMWGRLGESRFQGLAKRRAGHAVGAGQNEILQATGFKQAPHARSIRRKRVIAYKAQLKPRHAHTTEV
jgi:hypothetical protein